MDRPPPANSRRRWFHRLLAPLLGLRYRTETLRSVPSWGLSILLHSLVLLVMAFLIQIVSPGQEDRTMQMSMPGELGDLSSLVEASRSGDPFTTEDSLDPPSIGLEPKDSPVTFAGQPALPSLAYGPDLVSPSGPDSGGLKLLKKATGLGRANGGPGFPALGDQIAAPFSGRQELGRARLLLREGGTAQSEKSVERGLEWIVRHQRADGSWSLNFQDQCQADPCPNHRAIESDTAATGLALLPLLGAGNIHNVKCRHQDAVRRGIDWLISHQQPNGDLFIGPPGIGYLYSHAIATMALCEAYGLSQDPRLKQPATQAISFIIEAQDPVGGGWRYTPGQAGDTSVFGWNIFALRSAHLAGLNIPRATLRACSAYLDLASTDSKKILYAYQPGRDVSPVMTAEALVSRQLLGWPRDHPSLVKGVGRISAHLQSSQDRNIYYWYYATQLLHNMKNKDWDKWNPEIRDGLIKTQINDETCARGSWDPLAPATDRWGETGGQLFQTSLSILTLEVYYRYLPLYRTSEEEGMDTAPPKADAKAKKS